MPLSVVVQIEIINTGSELLLGRVLNTHQQFLCRSLADLGWTVSRQVVVADSGAAIAEAVRESLSRADLIITTGGLGPTSDDRTRELVAELLGCKLEVNTEILARISQWFCHRRRPMPESTSVQALVPQGSLVLMNAHGTAPGLVMDVPAGTFRSGSSVMVMLPGPPRELQPMFREQVVPVLKDRFGSAAGLVCRTLKTTGMGESRVEECLAPSLAGLVAAGLEIGYCARTGEVDVRFVARGDSADKLVAEAERITRRFLKDHVFGTDDEQLEQVVVRLLASRKQWLALAESCTGGFIAHRITNVPGASAIFWGGVVSYANDAKMKWLGVQRSELEQDGAVSERVARAMAEGARIASGADYALGVTGIAGPGGGTGDKPAGTVFLALASASGTVVRHEVNAFERETFKYVTSQQALEMLRRALQGDHWRG